MFLKKNKPITNGQRWLKEIYLRSRVTIHKMSVKVVSKSGRGVFGNILVRHRQTPVFTSSIKSINFLKLFGYGVISDIFFSYKKRIILMEVNDRFKNKWYARYISGLNYGDIINSGFCGVFCSTNAGGVGGLVGFLQPLQIFSQLQIFKFGAAAVSGGAYGGVISVDREGGVAVVYLTSKKRRVISVDTMCVIGRVGGEQHFLTVYGKAGSRVIRGIRPSVRGVAMNPVDHPHGGRTKTNSPELSPWGWVTKYNK